MSWSAIDGVLFSLDKVVFIAYFILLIIALLVERKVSSYVIALIVLAVANGAMTSLSPLLYEVASQPEIFYKFVWYASFALLDLFAVFLLYLFHKLLQQNVGNVARVVGFMFLTFATLQSARFIDRFVFDTEFLQQVYQSAIPLINIAVVPIILLSWLAELRQSQRMRRVEV